MAGTEYFTKDADEEMLASKVRPPTLVEPRPQDRVQRQIVEVAHVKQILDLLVPQTEGVRILAVAEPVILQRIPEAHAVDLETKRTISQYGDTDEEHVEVYSQPATLFRRRDRGVGGQRTWRRQVALAT